MKKLLQISILITAAFLTACTQQQPYYGNAQPVYNNGYNQAYPQNSNNGYYPQQQAYPQNPNNGYYPQQQAQQQSPSVECIAATAGGAIAGGLAGKQFGKGNGSKAAAVAGAVGGAMAGRQLGCR